MIARAHVSGLVVLVVSSVAAGRASAVTYATQPDDIVVVTEDYGSCDAVTMFSISTGEELFRRGPLWTSPGRLAATEDLRRLAIVPADSFQVLMQLRGDPADPDSYGGGLSRFTARPRPAGGVAYVDGGEAILLGEPQTVARYRLAGLGARTGQLATGGAPGEILLSTDGSRAHLIVREEGTNDTVLLTIDPVALRETAARVRLGNQRLLERMHAVITSDDRHVIVNDWDARAIYVVDAASRQSSRVDLDLPVAGDLAVSRGPQNRGILAVHGGTTIGLYWFDPSRAEAIEVGRLAIPAPDNMQPLETGPQNSLAWGSGGSKLVVATSDGAAEFAVLDVSSCGQTTSRRFLLSTCPAETNAPNGILTMADFAAAEGPVCPRPDVETPTPSATATEKPTSDPETTATATATPSPTSTRPPTPLPVIYLPLALRQSCEIKRSPIDVAIVLDTSTSMLETVGSRTKIELARDATLAFLGYLENGDRAAIVSFNETARVEQPLTSDRQLWSVALGRVQTGQFTRLDLGIQLGRVELHAGYGRLQVMVVLTDGKANPIGPEAAVDEATVARQAGVTIFVIGLGTPESLDDAALRAIAGVPTHYYQTPDANDLRHIYDGIGAEAICPGSSRATVDQVGRRASQSGRVDSALVKLNGLGLRSTYGR